MVFPVREVGDVVFVEFDRQVFASVGVEATPDADAVDAHQPDGEQLFVLALLAEFGLASFAKLGLHPFAVQAVLREHQQQAVVDLDGPVDLLDEFFAPLHVFRSEPDPQLFATQLLVQPPSELIVLAAIADDKRLVLNRQLVLANHRAILATA